MQREEAISKWVIPAIKNTWNEKKCKEILEALEQTDALDKIRAIVDYWKADTWTDNLSYECMVKIAELVEQEESEGITNGL